MSEISVEIAGLRTSIVTREPQVATVVRERYRGFLSTGKADWRIEMNGQPAGSPPFAEDVVVERDGGPARFVIKRADFAGAVDLRERSGTVTFRDPGDIPVDAFLRITCSLALVDARGLVLHAASLERTGRAYLFCGPSGSGKTTIAGLSPDAILLSDELSIARVSDGGAVCYRTPFWGEMARAGERRAAPLSAIYFLHHGQRHTVQAIGPRLALERLLPNVLFFARDRALTARVFSIAADLVEAIPCFDLVFRRDPGFWEVIERG
jgi:hypothetical protein